MGLVIICFCINFSGVPACSQMPPSSQPGFGLDSVLSCAFFLNLSLLKYCQMPTLSFLSSQETQENRQGSGFWSTPTLSWWEQTGDRLPSRCWNANKGLNFVTLLFCSQQKEISNLSQSAPPCQGAMRKAIHHTDGVRGLWWVPFRSWWKGWSECCGYSLRRGGGESFPQEGKELVGLLI